MASGASALICSQRLEKRVQRRDDQTILIQRLRKPGGIRIGFRGNSSGETRRAEVLPGSHGARSCAFSIDVCASQPK